MWWLLAVPYVWLVGMPREAGRDLPCWTTARLLAASRLHFGAWQKIVTGNSPSEVWTIEYSLAILLIG